MPWAKVKVGRVHIANAIKGDASHCMIAEAIREKFPNARWVLVDIQSIRWTVRSEGKRYIFLTPRAAQKALLKFDHGESVAPFDIRLENPNWKLIHPAIRRPTTKAKLKTKPNTIRYKHKKVAPEVTAVRQFGLRAIL